MPEYIAPWFAAVVIATAWITLAVVSFVSIHRTNRRLTRVAITTHRRIDEQGAEHARFKDALGRVVAKRDASRRVLRGRVSDLERGAVGWEATRERLATLDPEATPAGTADDEAPTWSARLDDGVTVTRDANGSVVLSIDGYGRSLYPTAAARIAQQLNTEATFAMHGQQEARRG
jgi:hypothetical protein